MGSFSFEFDDLKKFVASLDNFEPVYRRLLDRMLGDLTRIIAKTVEVDTPRKTGKLAESTSYSKEQELQYIITQNATATGHWSNENFLYGRAVRYGSDMPFGGGYIYPVKAKALHWIGANG